MIEINVWDSNIIQSVDNIQDLLTELALDIPLFDSIFTTAFGNNIDTEARDSLRQQWAIGNFQAFPLIEIRTQADLNQSNGAFSLDTGTIYLAEEFIHLHSGNIEAISQLILEEFGHYIDAEINLTDTKGDEGAIYSSLVRGIELTPEQLRLLREEDDQTTIILDGQEISIEQQVIGEDQRTKVTNTTTYPWNMIGWISSEWSRNSQSGGSLGGTGALFLSPYHVLTAAHLVWDKAEFETSGNGYASTVTINFGQTGQERFYGTARMTSMMTFNGYTTDSNWKWDSDSKEWDSLSSDYDLALITLDRNIGDHIGHFGYDTNSYKGLNINSAGYPADLANRWAWENGYHVPFEDTANVDLYRVFGPVTDVVGQTLRYQIDTSGGQSGSPVWRYDSDSGNRYLVGVHVVGSSSYNVAAQLTLGKIDTIENEINNSSVPIDKPDFVDYDEWFGTNFASFKNNKTGISVNDLSNSILSVEAGDFVTLHSVIRNNGTARVDGSLYLVEPTIDVSFYASTNESISDLDYKIAEITIPALDPFEWRDVILNTTFPNLPQGHYYIGYTFESIMSEF